MLCLRGLLMRAAHPSPPLPTHTACRPRPSTVPCPCAPPRPAEPLAADPALLDGVAVLLGKGASLAASCGAADWLLAAASPERGVGDALAALHSDVLAGMKVRGCQGQ